MTLFTNTPFLRTAALAAMVALGACSSKSDDATPTPAATTYATTWTADGKNYTATTSAGTVNNNSLSITALNTVSSTESYSVSLAVPAATGTYTIGGTSTTISAAYSTTVGSTNTSYIAFATFGSGTIVVTTLSATEIIGTFTFTGTNASTGTGSKAVTNGKFAIKR